jgi:hypothetical protein
MVAVEVLPFLEQVVEQLGAVCEDALELAVELLGVDLAPKGDAASRGSARPP